MFKNLYYLSLKVFVPLAAVALTAGGSVELSVSVDLSYLVSVLFF